MNLEQLKQAISEAFEKAAEEAAKKILEECPRKETKEEAWSPGGIIRTSIGDLAAEDYYEILEDGTKKTKFTWDEAMEIEKKTNGKWRLPTIFEWDRLVAEFGDKDGELDRDTFVKELDLTEDEDGYGNYWASTREHFRVDSAYLLGFDNFYVLRSFGYRCLGRSVRLVRGDE
jgi:hypothetical protein